MSGCEERLERLLLLAKPYLDRNEFGIGHTERVLRIAKGKLKIPRGDEELVVASIILHDIGGSTVKDQYEKGPKIAADLLRQLDYSEAFVQEVCEIIRTHHDRPDNPREAFKILFDADQLVRFSEEEFSHYESEGIDWNLIINRMYFEETKRNAREALKTRKREKRAPD